jgi:heterodisulfide reductase subunit A
MARLDKTFPTNDCSACMFSPKLSAVARNPRIRILTGSRLVGLEGEPGRFRAVVEKRPRYIDEDKCIACGKCAEKCPKKVPDTFNGELAFRKAAYLTFPQSVPLNERRGGFRNPSCQVPRMRDLCGRVPGPGHHDPT